MSRDNQAALRRKPWRGLLCIRAVGMAGANTAVLALNPTIGAMAGSYTVRIENSFGFALSVPVTLTVNCPDGDGNCDGVIDPVDAADLAKCLNGPGRTSACSLRCGRIRQF